MYLFWVLRLAFGIAYGKQCFFKPEAPMPGKSGDGKGTADLSQATRKIEARWNFGSQTERIKSNVGMTQFNVNKTACQTKKVQTCAKSGRKQELIFNLCVCVWYWCIVQRGKLYPGTSWFSVVFMHVRCPFQRPSLSLPCGFTERCRCRNNPDAVWATVR